MFALSTYCPPLHGSFGPQSSSDLPRPVCHLDHKGHRPGQAVGLMQRPWNSTRLAGQWHPATQGLWHGPISFQLSQVFVHPGPQVSYTAPCLHCVAEGREDKWAQSVKTLMCSWWTTNHHWLKLYLSVLIANWLLIRWHVFFQVRNWKQSSDSAQYTLRCNYTIVPLLYTGSIFSMFTAHLRVTGAVTHPYRWRLASRGQVVPPSHRLGCRRWRTHSSSFYGPDTRTYPSHMTYRGHDKR